MKKSILILSLIITGLYQTNNFAQIDYGIITCDCGRGVKVSYDSNVDRTRCEAACEEFFRGVRK